MKTKKEAGSVQDTTNTELIKLNKTRLLFFKSE